MVASPKTKYRIMLVQRTAYDFNVKASSHEEACKILERELRTHTFRRAELNQVVDVNWSDPKEPGEAWLVTRASDNWEKDAPPIMIWDGRKIVNSGIPPFPDDTQPQGKKKSE